MSDLVLSASSVATFMRCGQQWYYAYVEQRKSPPNLKQIVGIATHEAIEVNMTQKVESKVDLPTSDVLDAFSDSFDRQVADVEDDEEKPAEAKDSGIDLVRLYQTVVAPPIQPFWVEKQVVFSVNGQPYSGYLDLVEERQTALGPIHIIRDTKTTKRRPSGDDYLLNMTGYALGYRHETGGEEADIVLDYLVRTKTPQYVPVASGGPVDGGAVVMFADVVGKVAEAIKAGVFIPNGIFNNACSWCGYADICTAKRRAL